MKTPFFLSALALCCSFVCLSCNEEKIRTYRVATEDDGVETTVAPAEKTSGSLRWKAPENWKEKTPGQFQTALYSLSDSVKVAVSALPGDAGGENANVNRWRRQIGLEPAEDVGGEILAVEDGGVSAKWFDLRGPAESILAAIISLEGNTWFFKLSAPTAEIDARSAEFKNFLTTVGIETKKTPPQSPAPHAEDGGEKSGIVFETPAGWQKSEGSSMRVASFSIPGEDGQDGDVSVIPLGGASGSILENVNRWRAQLRLPALESETDPALGSEMKGQSGTLLVTHMVSENPLLDYDKKGAISTAILKSGDTTWFFKLTGEATLVAANREKFEAFVLSAKIP